MAWALVTGLQSHAQEAVQTQSVSPIASEEFGATCREATRAGSGSREDVNSAILILGRALKLSILNENQLNKLIAETESGRLVNPFEWITPTTESTVYRRAYINFLRSGNLIAPELLVALKDLYQREAKMKILTESAKQSTADFFAPDLFRSLALTKTLSQVVFYPRPHGGYILTARASNFFEQSYVYEFDRDWNLTEEHKIQLKNHQTNELPAYYTTSDGQEWIVADFYEQNPNALEKYFHFYKFPDLQNAVKKVGPFLHGQYSLFSSAQKKPHLWVHTSEDLRQEIIDLENFSRIDVQARSGYAKVWRTGENQSIAILKVTKGPKKKGDGVLILDLQNPRMITKTHAIEYNSYEYQNLNVATKDGGHWLVKVKEGTSFFERTIIPDKILVHEATASEGARRFTISTGIAKVGTYAKGAGTNALYFAWQSGPRTLSYVNTAIGTAPKALNLDLDIQKIGTDILVTDSGSAFVNVVSQDAYHLIDLNGVAEKIHLGAIVASSAASAAILSVPPMSILTTSRGDQVMIMTAADRIFVRIMNRPAETHSIPILMYSHPQIFLVQDSSGHDLLAITRPDKIDLYQLYQR